MDMETMALVAPVRAAIGVSAVVCVWSFVRALRGDDAAARRESAPFLRALLAWAGVMGVAAFLLSHTELVPGGARFLVVGPLAGAPLAFASLAWAPARRAFDRLTDAQIRQLSAYRALFGAFLFAGAALGLFPHVFAWVAGTGDLVAGWLAAAATGSLAAGGSRGWRAAVHGWGAIDLLDVFAMGVVVVAPWIVMTGSPGPSLLLPWLAVPLLLALNLHGLRRLVAERGAPASAALAA